MANGRCYLVYNTRKSDLNFFHYSNSGLSVIFHNKEKAERVCDRLNRLNEFFRRKKWNSLTLVEKLEWDDIDYERRGNESQEDILEECYASFSCSYANIYGIVALKKGFE
jgi:hypothetical protein